MPEFVHSIREMIDAHKKVFLLIGGGLILLLLVILSLPQSIKQIGPTPIVPSPSTTSSPQSSSSQQTVSPPSVSFESYENRSALPTVPQSMNTYTLKTNYTVEEAKSFGSKFGMTEIKSDDPKFVVMSNLTDMNNRGMLVFDKETGGFSFQSWGDQRAWNQESGIKNQELQKSITGYLSSLGIIDPTVSCPTTYQKQGLTGVTYVECHRDWSKVGGTILNFIGLLNVPEDRSLASLALGKPTSFTPNDPTIINTSDNSNGKARLTDFNTITVGVTDDGRILTIDSNLRYIVQSSVVTSDQLLTPQDALTQFINHKSELTLTIPAGSGSIDWNKVYPGNQASGKKAVITDYLLTYLEKSGQVPQDTLVPMYVIRGTAELSSGYTVRFTETVPATKSQLSFLSPLEGSVAGVSTSLLAQDDSGLKLGTFQPTIVTLPTDASSNPLPSVTGSSGGTTGPTPTGTSYSLGNCKDINAGKDKDVVMNVPGLGEMTFVYNIYPIPSIVSHMYFFKSATFPVKDMEQVREQFRQLVGDQYLINMTKSITGSPYVFASLDTVLAHLPTSANEEDKKHALMNEFYEKATLGNKAGQCLNEVTFPMPRFCETHPELFVDYYGNYYLNLYDFEVTRKVYDYVEQKFYDVYKQKQVNEWASKPNIFPNNSIITGWLLMKPGITLPPAYSQCYVSGTSPSLYLYPQRETKVNVKLPSSLSFSYPSAQEGNWKVIAHPDGTLSSTNNSYSRLYYEYDKSKVTFTEPKAGYVVKKNEWEGFIRNTLAPQLELTERETDDLVTDVRNTLVDVKDTNYSYLKISLADTKEVNEKLPVTISPKPDSVYRIHLILKPLDSTVTLRQPTIAPIRRNGFTAVEVGARIQ